MYLWRRRFFRYGDASCLRGLAVENVKLVGFARTSVVQSHYMLWSMCSCPDSFLYLWRWRFFRYGDSSSSRGLAVENEKLVGFARASVVQSHDMLWSMCSCLDSFLYFGDGNSSCLRGRVVDDVEKARLQQADVCSVYSDAPCRNRILASRSDTDESFIVADSVANSGDKSPAAMQQFQGGVGFHTVEKVFEEAQTSLSSLSC